VVDPLFSDLPLVRDYFLGINGGCLEQVAALFGIQGILHAPLDGPIQGNGAIHRYLATKAQGMTCHPETVTGPAEAPVVLGFVQAPAFGVRVEWTFQLGDGQIDYLRVRLLASAKELLSLKPLSTHADSTTGPGSPGV